MINSIATRFEAEREWRGTLKPGDKVAIEQGHGDPQIKHIEKVGKLHITLSHGVKYRIEDGYKAGANHGWYRSRIVPITDEVREKLERARCVSVLFSNSRNNWREVPTEKLQRIVAILKEGTAK